MNLVFRPSTNNDDSDEDNASSNFHSKSPSSLINYDCLYFSEPVQNTLMNDSYFIRIIYSDNDVSLFGLMIPLYFSDIKILKSFHKSIIMYDLRSHRDMITKISGIENSLLERYNHFLKLYKNREKLPVYNLTNQLNSCNIKLFDDIDKNLDECNLVLKISGVWENENEIGITFKFILLC